MEISEDLLRKIVRETLRELGAGAETDMVRKIVKEVIRRINQRDATKAPLVIAPQPSQTSPH